MHQAAPKRLLPVVIIVLVFVLCVTPVSAQYGQPGGDYTEQFLNWQDQMVLAQFAMYYPADYRYNTLLGAISTKFNEKGPEIFQNYGKEVYFTVFVSSLGFNAVSFHRIVVFDSLLLDTLRKLAEGIAFYGTIDNEYSVQLAATVLRVGMAHQFGMLAGNYQNIENPFGLPSCGALTEEQKKEANSLFEEMAAAVMAHEASHAFLDHVKEKIKTQQMLWMYNQGKVDPRVLNSYINNYLNYNLSYSKELEADTYAARLLKAAGYSRNGFTHWLLFAGLLERMTGSDTQANRTHPTSVTRIRNVKNIWDNVLESEP
ncbi:MAG: M48 family metalloprotease [Candidatus Eremiobacteraeota bacterium]|nr:M48 family metalloprotease [Candidatus Eremiobacteraeota bacterium]